MTDTTVAADHTGCTPGTLPHPARGHQPPTYGPHNPRPIPTREDRMRHATAADTTVNASVSLATYLDRQERAQLDARAAAAEQERDEALDDLRETRAALRLATDARDRYREQLDRANTGRQQLQADLDTMYRVRDQLAEALDLIATAVMAGTDDTLRGGIRSIVHRVRPEAIELWSPLGSPADRAQDVETGRCDHGVSLDEECRPCLVELYGTVPHDRAQDEPDLAPVIAHQWSVRYPDGFVDGGRFTEAGARQRATELGGVVVYRAVGPWESA